MSIKLIGVDNKNGIRLLKSLEKIEKELKVKFDICKVASSNRDKYGIRQVPALIINDEVVLKGNILPDNELKNLIRKKLLICNN